MTDDYRKDPRNYIQVAPNLWQDLAMSSHISLPDNVALFKKGDRVQCISSSISYTPKEIIGKKATVTCGDMECKKDGNIDIIITLDEPFIIIVDGIEKSYKTCAVYANDWTHIENS